VARRKKAREAPGELKGAFVTDPELAKTSPYVQRSPAEIHALQKYLGLKNPPEGVDIRPALSDYLATRASVGQGSGWGSSIYSRSEVRGKGKKAHLVYWSIPAGLLVAIFVMWSLERIGAALASALSFGTVTFSTTDLASWILGNVLPGPNAINTLGNTFNSMISTLGSAGQGLGAQPATAIRPAPTVVSG
jgi:hypothetical protein